MKNKILLIGACIMLLFIVGCNVKCSEDCKKCEFTILGFWNGWECKDFNIEEFEANQEDLFTKLKKNCEIWQVELINLNEDDSFKFEYLNFTLNELTDYCDNGYSIWTRECDVTIPDENGRHQLLLDCIKIKENAKW